MKLLVPVYKSILTQKFGENPKVYAPLKGHPALDYDSRYGFGTPLVASHACLIYKIVNEYNDDPMAYKGVFGIFEEDGQVYEISWGHFDKIYVEEGEWVVMGQTIGTMGNSGECYSNGRLVTKEEKLKGSKAGAHVHGPQLRPVIKTLSPALPGEFYLDNVATTGQRQDSLYRDEHGFIYLVKDYNNGFNGCIDPLPHIWTPALRDYVPMYANIITNWMSFPKGRNTS